jgi:hypothetical protein
LSVDGVSGKLALDTHNGSVALVGVGGDVRAHTQNGSLNVQLAGTQWDGTGLDAETRNGSVRLAVPAQYAAQLETGTVNGSIRTDIPVTVSGRISRQLSIPLGGGGRTVPRGDDERLGVDHAAVTSALSLTSAGAPARTSRRPASLTDLLLRWRPIFVVTAMSASDLLSRRSWLRRQTSPPGARFRWTSAASGPRCPLKMAMDAMSRSSSAASCASVAILPSIVIVGSGSFPRCFFVGTAFREQCRGGFELGLDARCATFFQHVIDWID